MSAASGSLAVEEWKARDKTRGRKRRRERERDRETERKRESLRTPGSLSLGNVRTRALFVLVCEREQGVACVRCEGRERLWVPKAQRRPRGCGARAGGGGGGDGWRKDAARGRSRIEGPTRGWRR